MNKAVLYFCIFLGLCTMAQTSFYSGWPDAIRCGADEQWGAIYVAHTIRPPSTSYYCQVFAGEGRCVLFDGDGNYILGQGHYGSRKGCDKKTISQLKAEGRTFQMTDQSKVRQRLAQMEQKMNEKFNLYEEKLQRVQNEHEARNKVLNQKIQKLQKQLNQLKNNQIPRLRDGLRECKLKQEKISTQLLRIQKLEKQVNATKKETDQKIESTRQRLSTTKSDLLKRIQVLEKKTKLLKPEFTENFDKLLQLMSSFEGLNLEIRLSAIQKQLKSLKADMLKKYTNLESQMGHCCSKEERQNEIQGKRYGKETEDKRSDIEVKAKNNLNQQIEGNDGQNPKPSSKPKK